MIPEPTNTCLNTYFCYCVRNDGREAMVNDNSYVTWPMRVGSYILFYGRKRSTWPYHCLVGPDWPFVIMVYFLIFVINIGVLYWISPLGWPPVVIGIPGAIFLLITYSMVAFSDPGIVYKNDFTDINAGDIEDPMHGSNAIPRVSFALQRSIECGNCNFQRPLTAHHCSYCKVCVNHLDHHCPWSGKCIGENNIKAFNLFVGGICYQFYYLLGALIYYLIYAYSSIALPHGPSFTS